MTIIVGWVVVMVLLLSTWLGGRPVTWREKLLRITVFVALQGFAIERLLEMSNRVSMQQEFLRANVRSIVAAIEMGEAEAARNTLSVYLSDELQKHLVNSTEGQLIDLYQRLEQWDPVPKSGGMRPGDSPSL